MANYAESSDVAEVISLDPPAGDGWDYELTKATRDILAMIKSDFWEGSGRDINSFDEDNLDLTQLIDLTVYRALGWYICPALENYSGGEPGKWSLKAADYKKSFDDEWLTVQQLPIYDFDEDDSFEDSERQGKLTYDIGRG